MSCYMQHWIRGNGTMTPLVITLTASWQSVFPLDLYRWGITIPEINGLGMEIGFGVNPPVQPVFIIPAASFWLSMTENDLGELIQQQIWMRLTASTGACTIWALGYNPERKRQYERWIHGQISRAGAL